MSDEGRGWECEVSVHRITTEPVSLQILSHHRARFATESKSEGWEGAGSFRPTRHRAWRPICLSRPTDSPPTNSLHSTILIYRLLRLRILQGLRSPFLVKNLASGAVAAFFVVVPMLAFVAIGGAGFPLLLKKEGVDPTVAVESGIVPALLVLALAAAYVHRSLQLTVLPLLSRPVKRRTIAWVMVAWSGVNVTQGLALVIALSMWSTGVFLQIDTGPALAWLAGLGLAVAALQVLAHLLRVLLHRTLMGFLATGVIGAGLLLLDLFSASSMTAEAGRIFFASLRNGEVLLPLLVAAVTVGLALLARRATRPILYTDDLGRDAAANRPSRDALRRLPVVLRTDARLMLRNRRTRMIAFNCLLWPFFGMTQIMLGLQQDQVISIIVGSALLPIGSLTFYLVHARRLRGQFFDGLLVRPISTAALTRSMMYLSDVALSAGVAVGVVYLSVVSPEHVPLLLAFGLYGAGVAHIVGAFTSLLPTNPYPPNLGNFDMTGATVGGSATGIIFASNVVVGGLPVVLCFLAPSLTAWYVAAVPAAAGLAGLAARPMLTRYASTLRNRRRYTLASGYRGDGS